MFFIISSRSPPPAPPSSSRTPASHVRSGTCSFYVKYLGCCEVFESRGMQVCEAAVANLKEQRRRTIRGTLSISGDSIRVMDEDTKGLILDQTIEKVSFCARIGTLTEASPTSAE